LRTFTIVLVIERFVIDNARSQSQSGVDFQLMNAFPLILEDPSSIMNAQRAVRTRVLGRQLTLHVGEAA
jgi:hypothetical protein